MNSKSHTSFASPSQRGVALVVALVLLVVVTLVGLAAIRGTTMQQQMTNNFYDRELGFQSAEAALRAGEDWVIANPTNNSIRNCQASGSQCWADPFKQADDSTDNWIPYDPTQSSQPASNFIQLVPTTTFNASALGSGQPQFVVEFLGACSASGGGNFQFTNDQNNQGGGGSLTNSGVCYRVTARSNANAATNDRSQITLQSIVRS